MEQVRVSSPWHVGVIGLGYVGLPLAVLFARRSHRVLGIDISPRRVDAVNTGQSYVEGISSRGLARLVRRGRLRASTDYDLVRDLDAVVLCLPTPLDNQGLPDLSSLLRATREIAPRLKPGALVVLESSSYPGTTEDLVCPLLEAAGKKVGKDFYLAYSPERVNPAAPPPLERIPKLLSGVTLGCVDVAERLYRTAFRRLVRVSSPRVAEMAKLVENAHRLVNIAFVNDMAQVSHKLGLDVWEVLEAAGTKPFGYTPHLPGPGVGGHCIPVDPLYLQWSAHGVGAHSPLIAAADEVNRSMPAYVVRRLAGHLGDLTGRRVLLLGLAYKQNVADIRESPALLVLEHLAAAGVEAHYHDPHVDTVLAAGREYRSEVLSTQLLRAADAVVVLTAHDSVDYRLVADEAKWILDTRNALGGLGHLRNVERL